MLKISNLIIDGLVPVEFAVNAGECIGITGESGCGKTRLLRAIADMDEFEGNICLDEVCRQDVPAHEWRRRVCLLPAESQWWCDTVGPHFEEEPTDLGGVGFDAGVLSWQLSRCSSGEKQRLALLRLLANRPRVLLLDEPTANLDAENTRKVEAMVTAYLKNNNAMALWVSHNQAQLARVAVQYCYRLLDGRLERIESDPVQSHA